MKLILVRHGKSIANEEEQYQGISDEWRDTSLHDKGILQAKSISEILKCEKIDFAYSSPLKRAKETAEIILNFHDLELIIDKRLEEKQDTESKEEFIFRCKNFLYEISKKEGVFLAISHAGVIFGITCNFY